MGMLSTQAHSFVKPDYTSAPWEMGPNFIELLDSKAPVKKPNNQRKKAYYTSVFEETFSGHEGYVVSTGVCTYANDIQSYEGATFGMQPVDGWDIASDNGDGRAAAIFAYGSDAFLGSPGYEVPMNRDGYTLGMVASGGASVQYTRPIALPEGDYEMRIYYYNAGGSSAIAENLFGFITTDGTPYLAPTSVYPEGEGVENINFTFNEDTNGVFSLGYRAANTGSSNMPHLFIEAITIHKVTPNLEDIGNAICQEGDGSSTFNFSNVDNNLISSMGGFPMSLTVFNAGPIQIFFNGSDSLQLKTCPLDGEHVVLCGNGSPYEFTVTAQGEEPLSSIVFNASHSQNVDGFLKRWGLAQRWLRYRAGHLQGRCGHTKSGADSRLYW